MKGPKRSKRQKRAERKARQRAFYALAERATYSPGDWREFVNEMAQRTRHLEYAEFREAVKLHLEGTWNRI